MMQYKLFIWTAVMLIGWSLLQGVDIARTMKRAVAASEAVAAIQAEREELLESVQSRYAPVSSIHREEPFRPLDILLEEDLQQHTWNLCEAYSGDTVSQEELFDLALRVMWQESRHQKSVPDHRNANGTVDRGLMQINSVNWGWLDARGLDVSDPADNIEAGILILARLLEQYPVEHALTAYCNGESGAAYSGGKSRYATLILSMEAADYTELKDQISI